MLLNVDAVISECDAMAMQWLQINDDSKLIITQSVGNHKILLNDLYILYTFVQCASGMVCMPIQPVRV